MFVSTFPLRFGSIELTRELGAGGTATVYEGYRIGAGGVRTRVAVKVLLPDRAWEEKSLVMFIDEARLNSHLHHPNIVAIHDFSSHGGIHYIVMEYISGCDLAALLETLRETDRRVPPDLVVRILEQILTGLAYAHEATDGEGGPLGLVHRDLKPANIFLTRHGEVKIGDFGIAKTRLSMLETNTGVFKGTPSYFSPEQFRGEPLKPASDLFAVGLILFEMLVGERLLGRKSLAELAGILMRFDAAQVSGMLPLDAAPFAPFLARCLASSLDERFSSAREALESLARLRECYPGSRSLGAWLEPLLPDIEVCRERKRQRSSSGEESPRPVSATAGPLEGTASREELQEGGLEAGQPDSLEVFRDAGQSGERRFRAAGWARIAGASALVAVGVLVGAVTSSRLETGPAVGTATTAGTRGEGLAAGGSSPVSAGHFSSVSHGAAGLASRIEPAGVAAQSERLPVAYHVVDSLAADDAHLQKAGTRSGGEAETGGASTSRGSAHRASPGVVAAPLSVGAGPFDPAARTSPPASGAPDPAARTSPPATGASRSGSGASSGRHGASAPESAISPSSVGSSADSPMDLSTSPSTGPSTSPSTGPSTASAAPQQASSLAGPAPAPPVRQVKLVLSSLPIDRTISIDGAPALAVPWTGMLSSGPHRITFHCEGYDQSQTVDLSDGQSRRLVWNCPARMPFTPGAPTPRPERSASGDSP